MSVEAWGGTARMTPRDVENAERHEREREEVLALLRPIVSDEMYTRLMSSYGHPDVHQGCDENLERIIEAIARHFGDLGPAIRAVADHVFLGEGGSRDTRCALVSEEGGATTDATCLGWMPKREQESA